MYNTPPPGVLTRRQLKEHMKKCEEETSRHHEKFHGSTATKRSTASSAAKRKQLELQAAEAKAKIELELIDRRLEANLAQLEIEDMEDDKRSDSIKSLDTEQKRMNTSAWVKNEPGNHRDDGFPLDPAVIPQSSAAHAADQTVIGIRELAHELKNMMDSSSSQREQRLLSRLSTPKDLPTFSGDCVEWLHFKSSYDESTRVCHYNDSENLWRIRKALKGEALEAVTDLLIGNTPPAVVMDALALRFGRPDIIINNITAQLRKLQALPTFYQYDLSQFAIKVNNCVATIRALKQDDYLRSPELADAVMSKLTSTLIAKWTEYAYEKILQGKSKLEVLATFLMHEIEVLSIVGLARQPLQQPSVPTTSRKPEQPSQRPDDNKYRNRNVFVTTATDVPSTNKCKFCKRENHLLTDCRAFKRAMRKDRWRYLKANGICFCCLIAGHDSSACTAPACEIDACGLAHHSLLHYKKPTTQQTVAVIQDQEEIATSSPSETIAHVAGREGGATPTMSSSDVLLKVVRVNLCGPSGIRVSTYALLDDAASVSIIDAGLSNELGLKPESSSAIKFIDAFGLEVLQAETPKVSATISDYDSKDSYQIKLRSVTKLNLPMQNLTPIAKINCEYLSPIKDLVCKQQVVPRLLIGEDNYYLIAPLQLLHGSNNEPYATQCRLGWTIHGNCARTHSDAPVSKHIFHLTHSDVCYQDDNNISELNDLIKDSFGLDSIGISTSCRENTAHIRATRILDDTARNIGDQWEAGLPFKKDEFLMPTTCSYNNALSRLQGLMNKFKKDDAYADRYAAEINKLFDDGYARELDTSVHTSRNDAQNVWYLPHFGVQNPNKPGKLRLVFDAASKVRGKCLNDYLLTGPDLYNSLFGMMLRVRENKIVIIGDIKDMFLRIRIREEDQHVLRFLWQRGPESKLKVCVMQSLIFGATCSPFIAQYIKNKNALKFEDECPEAVQVIINNHYMDDCVYSCNSTEKAIKLVHEITSIHKHGGFEIRRWSSNDKKVLETIPSDALAQTAVQFKHGVTNTSERTLGLIWHPADDTFGIQISLDRISQPILDGTEPPTKAKMLSILMSVYDIHGFLSPFLIKSKIIFQSVHRSGVDWNCRIQPTDHVNWVMWLNELKQLTELRIPRWYHDAMDTSNVVDTQLHVFCDASMKAYATVMYWRFTYADGRVLVTFVASKSRVTPLRPISIPRLELQGALIGARLAKTVISEHKDIKPSKRYFWTDSSTVLQWIRSDPRTYKPYVAHRLGEIDELTKVPEWRYVPTSVNVADIATREDAPPLKANAVWFQGPAFLHTTEDNWPKDLKNSRVSEDAECEQRNLNVTVVCESQSNSLCLPNEDNISSWIILLRCTARILLLFRKGQANIDVTLMKQAEVWVLKKSQQDSFANEIECLRKKMDVKANSRLAKLTPYLDEDGLLRVGGRIDKTAGVSVSTMRPVILDGRHRSACLLVEWYHKKALHGANELVVNELRQRYWVVKLRPAVRAAAARCLFCRYRRAAPLPQRMGDLPAARLQHNRRPFTFTGMDFFGPMEVTIGRRRCNRYGVVFTCLTIRAIHIEITENLTTDSTIMAIARMSGRRGAPAVIYCDNGTNLRGSETELKRSLQQLNTSALHEDGTMKGTQWKFIPPGAPEMGGAWERMVRSIKTALKVVLKERAPHEETLATLMVEVEALVNSRPVTHVSTDPNYPEALTPNHFLIGTSSNGPPLGKYDDGDLCLRKKWRIAQRLTDMFWGRWLKEYLPTLLPRQKWTSEHPGLRDGDYVLLVDPKSERGCWRHGIVSAAHSGSDGRVRVVDVRTRTGVLRRPVTRVALLSAS